MGEFRTYKCDECGALKKESNHWFILRIIADATRIVLEPLEEKFSNHPLGRDEYTLCSKGCVLVQIERFMQRVMGQEQSS
jgi:hypothetical protein